MKLKEWAAFVLLGLIWGSSFLWIKIGVEGITPMVLVTLRVSFGLLALGGLNPTAGGEIAHAGVLTSACHGACSRLARACCCHHSAHSPAGAMPSTVSGPCIWACSAGSAPEAR